MAEMVTTVFTGTGSVGIVNVALLLPAGTCTNFPGYASPEVVCRSTSVPGAGAIAVNVTVPVMPLEPPISDVLLRARVLKVTGAGCSVMDCDLFTPPGSVAVTTTAVEESTGFVRTVVWPDCDQE